MASVWREATATVIPGRNERDGPLPLMLLALTAVTGLIDAVSFLGLGRVFVANMTGNVVFVGFALAGAQGFSIGASLTALAGFCLGAVAGGRISRAVPHRGRALLAGGAVQTVLFAAALATRAAGAGGSGGRYTVLALTAVAMGTQNAVVRSLGVADLTTTVLTQTITAMFADSPPGGGTDARAGRRLLAAIAMLLGALAGTLLVIHPGTTAALATAVALLAVVTATTGMLARTTAPWTARR